MILKTIQTLAVLAFISSAASAEQRQVDGTVVGLEPIYSNRTVNTPHQVCNTVQVPMNHNSNVLQGAIIGGILGNSLRGGDRVRNRNRGALLGALIVGNQSSGQGMVRQETQCRTQYRQSVQTQLEQYWVMIDVHGQIIRRTVYPNHNLSIGQTISLWVNYSLN